MPGAVHLMLVHISPPFIQAGKCVKSVDVSVRSLGGSEFINPFVRFFLHFGIRIVDQAISHAFQRFIYVGIIKENAGMLSCPFRRILEIADTPGLILYLIDTDRQGSRDMFAESG